MIIRMLRISKVLRILRIFRILEVLKIFEDLKTSKQKLNLRSTIFPKIEICICCKVWHRKLANGKILICAEPNPNSVGPTSMRLEGIKPGSPKPDGSHFST